MADPKLAILMPTTATRTVPLWWAIQLRTIPIPMDHVFIMNTGYQIDQSRTTLIEDALANPDITHVLWWDDDIWPSWDGIQKLVAHGMPIISGVYRTRRGHVCAGVFTGQDHPHEWTPMAWPQPKPVSRVDIVGLGFCLMDIRVFRRLSRPFFRYADGVGEDVYLFRKIKDELDLPIWVDNTIQCGHETSSQLMPDGTAQFLQQSR